MKHFERKFTEILDLLNTQKIKSNQPSLISGDIGRLLFNLHSFEYLKDEKLFDSAIEDLEGYLENIVIEDLNPSYCTGFAGFGFFLEYIEQKGWVEMDTNDMLGDIDEYLYDKMMEFIKVGHYDFLHGAIGIGFYFIYRSRKNKFTLKYLEDLIFELERQAVVESDGSVKWNFYDFKNNYIIEGEYNMGLSHGIPSILSFLLKAYQVGILPEKTLKISRSATQYILKTKLDFSTKCSVFPDLISEVGNYASSTRLAWCYGDLGVCCSLWQASKTLNDTNLQKETLEIMLRAASMRILEQTMIVDAGLCHGSAAAAHIFQRFYDWTGEATLKEAADYWYDITLNMAKFEDGYAGYKAYATPEFGGERPSIDFLEGISGIGLVLLYKISGIDPSWEELLFIR